MPDNFMQASNELAQGIDTVNATNLRIVGIERGPRVLITGGAGFIGTNLAHRLLSNGAEVRILDSLARANAGANVEWLKHQHRERLDVWIGDVRDADLVGRCVRDVDHIVHLAAQVAVTTGLEDPRTDFEINCIGTMNVLEAIRTACTSPSLTFCSTNKVYGALPDLALTATERRYQPADQSLHLLGIDETSPLDFHSPHGCSKGAADQYVLDYARTFGLRAVVFRMSSIYGPHQLGNEDQGWVTHFLRSAIAGLPLTLFGDGRQVRDLLYVEDLVGALECARVNVDTLKGRAFNIGGGPRNTLSLLELIDCIETLCATRIEVNFAAWRPGDQKYYVSNTDRFRRAIGWQPSTGIQLGLERLFAWLQLELAPQYSRPMHKQSAGSAEVLR